MPQTLRHGCNVRAGAADCQLYFPIAPPIANRDCLFRPCEYSQLRIFVHANGRMLRSTSTLLTKNRSLDIEGRTRPRSHVIEVDIRVRSHVVELRCRFRSLRVEVHGREASETARRMGSAHARLERKVSGYKVTGYGVFLGRASLLRALERRRTHYYAFYKIRCNLVTP